MEEATLYNDNIFIVGAFTKKIGDIQNSAVKYYAFDASALGLEITSTTPDYNDSIISIYPNPSREYFIINFNKVFHGKIQLLNSLGQMVNALVVDNVASLEVSCLNYPPGMYSIQIFDNNDRLIGVNKIAIY